MKSDHFKFLFIVFSLVCLAALFFMFSGSVHLMIGKNSASQSPLPEEKRYLKPESPPSGDLLVTQGNISDLDIDMPLMNPHDTYLGKPSSPIAIFQFSNFENRYGAEIESSIKQVQKDYSGKIVLVWKDYLMENVYPNARDSSTAAHCAKEQNKFWEYHDLLINSLNNKEAYNYLGLAKQLNLDLEKFNECIKDNNFDEYFSEVKQEASALSLPGIPFIYINNQPLHSDITYENLVEIIESEL